MLRELFALDVCHTASTQHRPGGDLPSGYRRRGLSTGSGSGRAHRHYGAEFGGFWSGDRFDQFGGLNGMEAILTDFR
jgi:hypothetical protein